MSWGSDPQLRSWEGLRGLPGPTKEQQELVQEGNELVDFSAQNCKHLEEAGAKFGLENPDPSSSGIQPGIVELTTLSGGYDY